MELVAGMGCVSLKDSDSHCTSCLRTLMYCDSLVVLVEPAAKSSSLPGCPSASLLSFIFHHFAHLRHEIGCVLVQFRCFSIM